MELNKKQLCKKLNITEEYLEKYYSAVENKAIKEGYLLSRKKEKGVYEYTLVERNKMLPQCVINSNILRDLKDYCFLLFLFLDCLENNNTFVGTMNELMMFLNIKKTPANSKKLRAAIELLRDQKYVYGAVDPNDNTIFNLTLSIKYIGTFRVQWSMIAKSYDMSKRRNKRGYGAILKTWIAIQYCFWENCQQTRTINELVEMTSLSKNAVRESLKILREDNVIMTKKVYYDYHTCIGTELNINAFEKENQENPIIKDNEPLLFEFI